MDEIAQLFPDALGTPVKRTAAVALDDITNAQFDLNNSRLAHKRACVVQDKTPEEQVMLASNVVKAAGRKHAVKSLVRSL